jgi:ligand-binding sensor domain-containing protein/two-component sensor histidine kinase
VLLAASAWVQAERLAIQTFTTANGLADNTINRIVRDSRGFLWFCTEEGLSRFDGYEFVNFGTDQGLPHPYVNDLLETREGEYWIATNAGLVHFNVRGVAASQVTAERATNNVPMFTTVVPADDDRRARAITTLFEDHKGTIWCGTLKGLYRLDRIDGGPVLTLVDIGIPGGHGEQEIVTAIVEDKNQTLWIATHQGLYRRWSDGGTARYTIQQGLPDNVLHHLLIDHEGQIWVSSRYAGFFRLLTTASHAVPSVTFTLAAHDFPQTEWTSQLLETADHEVWAATARGLLECIPNADKKQSSYRVYTPRNGLSDDSLSAIAEDIGGNLWLGSGTGAGAMKVTRNGFVTFGEQDGVASVRSIFTDLTGGVCFRGYVLAGSRGGVFEAGRSDQTRSTYWPQFGRFDGNQLTWFVPDVLKGKNFGWVDENVTLQARTGQWWIAMGQALYHFPRAENFAALQQAKPLDIFAKDSLLQGRQVWQLFEDSHERIWVSLIDTGNNGLAYWDSQTHTWRDLTNEQKLPSSADDLARSFSEDGAGDVWIGFNTGVARFRQGTFTFFTTKDGLPAGAIQAMYLDHSGRLWLASSRGGLIRINDPHAAHPMFVSCTTAQGLSSNGINTITEDLQGRIYVGTGRGLDQLNVDTGHIRHFTTTDGIASGAFMSAFRDHNGTLWFGTHGGLSKFTPSPSEGTALPTILITSLEVAGVKQMVSMLGETNIWLPESSANQNQLQVNFVGLSFAPGEVLRYQYKLEGANNDWSQPTEQRIVTYANLAPGRYKFLVRAVNSHGDFSSSPATISFSILPPIWQRWWFITLAAVVLAMIIYWFYRYRLRRLLEITNIRARIATDLHDDIGANLTRIALLSEVARQQAATNKSATNEVAAAGNGFEENPLVSVGRIARESAGSMSDIVWAISPEHDRLLDLTRKMRQHADEIFTLRNIDLKFKVPEAGDDPKLGSDVRRDLLLIFKEAVNNAVRHSRCSYVQIDFSIDDPNLVLDIVDNGVGFDQSIPNQGQGLRSMKRRALLLGGTLEINSSPGSGTRIGVKIPFTRRRRLI